MDYSELQRTGHAVGQNCFHLIWKPKYAYPVFRKDTMKAFLRNVLHEIAARHCMQMHELCIESDHVHVFAELPPTMSVSKALQLLKGGSSYRIRRQLVRMRKYKALWSIGKFYRSVGAVTDTAISRYINDTHHMSKIPEVQSSLSFD